MPPRPRSTHRQAQSTTPSRENVRQPTAQLAKQARRKAFLSEYEGAEHLPSTIARIPNADDDMNDDDTYMDSDGDKEDTDAPRVAQWIDDEDFELHEQTDDASDSEEDEEEDHSASEAEPSRRLRSLQDDLSTLPLGTLRSAQRSLAKAQALSDTDSDPEEQSESGLSTSDDHDPHPRTVVDHGEVSHWSPKQKDIRTKRSNKHAPVEVTSKRPVSRRRVVIDDKQPKSRDPRFVHGVGRYDSTKFKQHYGFLSNLRNDELVALRGYVKRAHKLLANSPADLRGEREEEVKSLERAMKRTESAVNLDNRERVEVKALQSARQAEKEKRKQGKANWWMKRSEKKEIIAKARLDAIALAGGKQAVKKAKDRKRKKISQKEKKARPFPPSEGIGRSDGQKRRPAGSVDLGRGVKRRKVV